MGRLKKYKTEDDERAAQKRYSKNYYWKNKERLDTEARNRYQNKIKSQKNELREDL